MFLRKNKRRSKRVHKKLIIIIVFFIVTGSLLYLCFLFFVKKPLFISPIPGKLITNTSNILKSTDFKNQEKIRTIEDELKKEGIQYTTVEISTNAAILIVLSEGGEVVFSQEKDLAYQISSLQRVLSRFTIEGKKFKLLDFRFDRPFVKLK